MSDIITPFDDPTLLAKCLMTRSAADLATDFPCVIDLWHMDDASIVSTTITVVGRVSGITATLLSATLDANGMKFASGTFDSTFDLSAMDSVGLAGYLNVVGSSEGLTIGHKTNYPTVSLLAGATASKALATDGSNHTTPGLITTGTAGIHAAVAQISGQTCAATLADADLASATDVAGLDTTTGTIAAPTLDAVIADDSGGPGRRWKWIMLLGATSSLLDIAAAATWMTANDGYLYPGWYKRN